MKIKQLAKKLIASVSCLTVATAISLSAFALNENANNKDGHEGGWEGGLPGYNNTNDYGYAVSLVDGNGKAISSVQLDAGGLYTNTSERYKSVGTDPNSAGIEISESSVPLDMPAPLHWTGNGFDGNGAAVRDYLLDESSGEQKIVTIAKDNFAPGDKGAAELESKLNTGEIQVVVEPMLNLPVYTDLPAGTTREGGLKVVTGHDKVTGAAYNYWANADGSAYVVSGTIRDYIKNELRPYGGGGTGGYLSKVVKQTVKSFLLSDDAYDSLKALSDEEINNYIESYILHGDLDSLGIGMYIYSNAGDPPPPPPPPTPQTSKASMEITESRITRRYNLADPQLQTGLYEHDFKWDIEAFTIVNCNGCHHISKKITDNDNTINIEQSKDNDEADGVIKNWTFVTDGNSVIPKFIRDWSQKALFLLPTDKQNSYAWF